jgi:hypothetical protein
MRSRVKSYIIPLGSVVWECVHSGYQSSQLNIATPLSLRPNNHLSNQSSSHSVKSAASTPRKMMRHTSINILMVTILAFESSALSAYPPAGILQSGPADAGVEMPRGPRPSVSSRSISCPVLPEERRVRGLVESAIA